MTKLTRLILGLTLLNSTVAAQQYVISTIAGGTPPATPVRGLDLSINTRAVAADAAGNAYFTTGEAFSGSPPIQGLHCVFKLDQDGIVTLVAGNSRPGYSGDGGPATAAQLDSPLGLTVDGAGNVFIGDRKNHRVRKVSPSGIIVTVAGNGTQGFAGDGGPATDAQLNSPRGLAVDGAGNLFIADVDNHRVRRVSPDGIITTVAGNGSVGVSGDGGPATGSPVFPTGVAVDGAGNLFIADPNNGIRKVSRDGVITRVVGNGTGGFSGDGGPATSAQVFNPAGVAVDGAGTLFIADQGRIRKVSSSGIISTVADRAAVTNLNPTGVAVDGAGNLFIADNWSWIRKVSPGGSISTVAGNGQCCLGPSTFLYDSPYEGPATRTQLIWPTGVAVDGAGNLFIADPGRVRKVSPAGTMTTVAGYGAPGFSGDGGPATSAHIGGPFGPFGVAVDGAGIVFLSDTVVDSSGYNTDYRVRKVSPSGIITTVAGNGTYGPAGLAVDGAGGLFIADSVSNRIRKVSPDGTINTVAGNGAFCSYSPSGQLTCPPPGDGGPAASAPLNWPLGVTVDEGGNLFIASTWGGNEVNFGAGVIRKVSSSGIITTVAGNGASCFYVANGLSCPPLGDGGPAASAHLTAPTGVAVDGAGNVFIVEVDSNRIRKVSPDGIITTVAGNGISGYSGDGGFAASAQLSFPEGVAVDRAGNVYIADTSNHAVRVLRPTNRSILIRAVVDGASQSARPITPGKIVVIYGAGLGPAKLVRNQPVNGRFNTAVGGTSVSFNGIAAPVLYASETQVAAVAPYAISGATAQVTVTYRGQASEPFAIPVALSAPSLFTLSQTGAGQAAAINAMDGSINDAAHPVKVGAYISLYATGEGQTTPPGQDGILGGAASRPILPVSVTVGGIPATYQYAGAAPGQVAGLMQVNVQVPKGVQPGGYVPVVMQVGDVSTTSGAVWIAVAGN